MTKSSKVNRPANGMSVRVAVGRVRGSRAKATGGSEGVRGSAVWGIRSRRAGSSSGSSRMTICSVNWSSLTSATAS